jgi:chemotaxis protein methyltransferase CheR
MSLPPLLLEDLARVLAEAAGLSLTGGLDLTLADGLDAAARAEGEPARAFARRVLAREPGAITVLIEHVVVSETAFWRHPEQLAAIGRLAAEAPGPLAIWSAGCATGEEPYSVAIALLEAGRAGKGDRILATDVSARALEAAAAGVYGVRATRKLPPALGRWLETGFERRVRPEVRALVELRRHNLVAEPAPGGPFDVVLCRNVLIYFDPRTAGEVVRRLAGALRPGGVLVLGPVELPLATAGELELVRVGEATLLRRPGLPAATPP